MKAMLYMPKRDEPVAVLDEVKVVEFNDNHQSAPVRVFYSSKSLNSGKAMIEFHRDEKMLLRLEDGRSGDVLLQHSSLDMNGNAVGVLRVLGPLQG
jgi:hypothetical protein